MESIGSAISLDGRVSFRADGESAVLSNLPLIGDLPTAEEEVDNDDNSSRLVEDVSAGRLQNDRSESATSGFTVEDVSEAWCIESRLPEVAQTGEVPPIAFPFLQKASGISPTSAEAEIEMKDTHNESPAL